MTLRSASAFGPEPPFFVATAAIATHTNFEIFVKGAVTTPQLVWSLCSALRDLFKEGNVQGRVELRFGQTIQFVDFDLVGRGSNAQRVVECVRRVYSGLFVTMMLHPGKAQAVTLDNCSA